jgi:hypothetical protein
MTAKVARKSELSFLPHAGLPRNPRSLLGEKYLQSLP